MAIRTIRKEEDPILRKISKPVAIIDDKIKLLVQDMIDTMYDADGVGLAAPQIGILKRVITIDIYDETGVKVMINPELVSVEGQQCELEGCLSVPNKSGLVKRPTKAIARGLNLDGEMIEVVGEGLLAIALCHEIDHLNGILYIDKVVEELLCE
jgi:peptide deformylase